MTSDPVETRGSSASEGPRLPTQRDSGGSRADETSSLITPFTIVPRWLAKSTAGQLVWNIVLFVALPAGAFGYWTVEIQTARLAPGLESLRNALPIAAIWVVSSPILMYIGERAGARWVGSLAMDESYGWNVERVRKWKRWVDLTYYPTAILGGLAAMGALVLALPTVHDVVPAPAGWGTAIRFYVFGQAGFTAMGGLNGVLRWIVVTRASVSETRLRWHPFRKPQHQSLKRSYQLSLMLGIFFSCGALFVPTLVAVIDVLSPSARVIIWAFILLLLTGGVLIFIIPILTLSAALARGKDSYLASLDAPIGDLIDEMVVWSPRDGQDQSRRFDVIERMLALRATVVGVRLLPIGPTFGRATLTTIVPIFSFALSLAQSGLVHLW